MRLNASAKQLKAFASKRTSIQPSHRVTNIRHHVHINQSTKWNCLAINVLNYEIRKKANC